MDEKDLRQALFALHRELENTDSVDAVSAELLSDLRADIEQILEPDAARAEPGAPSGFGRRLRELLVEFEDSHPVLAASLRRTLELLGQAGI